MAALPVVWCLCAAALFGAATPISKLLLEQLNPLLLSGLLYAGAALSVLPWALAGRQTLRNVDRRNLSLLLGAVLSGGLLGPVLLLCGLALASAASVSLWLTLESVATALLARALFREHLQRATWIAVALMLIASLLLARELPKGELAIVLVALACVAWGFDNNLTANIDRFSPAQITFAKGLVAGSVNCVAGLSIAPAAVSAREIAFGLVVGALGYGASMLLYIRGAQQLGAARSQLVFATAPGFGLLLAWAAVGERISALQLLAAGLMGASLWFWHRERHAHWHHHAAMRHTHAHRHDDGHHTHRHEAAADPHAWHSHEHTHEALEHTHEHHPDLHHRHEHEPRR
jgi:drug/metabolite transporter (DMT)-like permease